MKAALYIRVSTDEQAEEGFSISAQLNQLTSYCTNNNIEIYKTYVDEGISGQKENRPAFQEMLKDAEKKLFNVILVHKFDRFARKVELSQRVKNQLKKTGINVISITEPLEDSPMGFFVSGLHDLLAEYYVRNLAQETKKGHIERASQGLHNGSVPFGYHIDKLTGDMVINEDQAKIVRWIFEMYNKEGYGSTKIATILNQHNIKTAVNGTWAHFTVNRILKNVKYIGKIYYDGTIYEGKHKPIISEQDFYLANKNKKDRTNKWSGYRGKNFNKFLLLGISKCGECGYSIRIHSASKSNSKRKTSLYSYSCNQATRYLGLCNNTKHYAAAKLEKHVIDFIENIINNINIDFDLKNKVNVNEILDNRKDKISIELSRAKKAYLAEVFSLEEFTEIKNKLDLELKEIDNSKIKEEDKDYNKKLFRKEVRTMWDDFNNAETVAEKREKLSNFVEVILIYKDRIEIKFYR